MNKTATFGFFLAMLGALMVVALGMATCGDVSKYVSVVAKTPNEVLTSPIPSNSVAPPPSRLPAPYRPGSASTGPYGAQTADGAEPGRDSGPPPDTAAKPKGRCTPQAPRGVGGDDVGGSPD